MSKRAYRVKFDFKISFTNGGGIQGEDFRLDIKGHDIQDQELANHLIADMNLLMVGKVEILNKVIIEEAHKRVAINPEQVKRIVDLSHTIEDGMITYKGLPAPIICDYISREDSKKQYTEDTQFQIGKIDMVSNTGTYLDCPFHRFEGGEDLAETSLDKMMDLDGIVIRVPWQEKLAIDVADLQGYEIRNRAVLIHTGWDEHWSKEQYFENHPYLTEKAAEYLKNCAVTLVGIDSHNIDDTSRNTRPVHTVLLGSGILIVEHLCNLTQVPDEGFLFTATPPKFKGVGTFPVRAMAKIKTS
ncbi:MAG: cyclase family protein [Cyclobacteriaceae bacterium]